MCMGWPGKEHARPQPLFFHAANPKTLKNGAALKHGWPYWLKQCFVSSAFDGASAPHLKKGPRLTTSKQKLKYILL
jgi:hypothetical protein